MNDNYIYIRLRHKSYSFIRTESGLFEVSECELLPNEPINSAAPTPDSTVAGLLAQEERETQQRRDRRRASRIRRLRKEEVVN